MTTRTHTVRDSPVGPLVLVAQDDALAALHMHEQRHLPDPATYGAPDDGALPAVGEQLDAYFAGQLTSFDVPLHLEGTPFQLRVWSALREIPYGRTASYGELAARIGRPTASRAVGMANGRNPIAIIVPCHRVVGSDGRLVGYGGGVDRKRRLLALEGALLPTHASR
jgi:methylated-DNA-[protein]-cysteine S-methyltransferase